MISIEASLTVGVKVCCQDAASLTRGAQVDRQAEIFHLNLWSSIVDCLTLKKIWEQSSGPESVFTMHEYCAYYDMRT